MTTVLITGANRGIGLALVRRYADVGANIIACCRDPATAGELRGLEATFDPRVRIMQLDVAKESSVASIGKALGDQAIDIIINNAGILGPEAQSASYIDAEGWMNTLRVNALAPVLIAIALRHNLKRGVEKKLVAITSVYGSTAVDYGASVPTGVNRYAYRASKAALNNGMRALARDWAGDGIIVGLLDPGWVQTGMTGGVGKLSPDESAQGIIDRIAELQPVSSGTFQRYWGEAIPW